MGSGQWGDTEEPREQSCPEQATHLALVSHLSPFPTPHCPLPTPHSCKEAGTRFGLEQKSAVCYESPWLGSGPFRGARSGSASPGWRATRPTVATRSTIRRHSYPGISRTRRGPEPASSARRPPGMNRRTALFTSMFLGGLVPGSLLAQGQGRSLRSATAIRDKDRRSARARPGRPELRVRGLRSARRRSPASPASS